MAEEAAKAQAKSQAMRDMLSRARGIGDEPVPLDADEGKEKKKKDKKEKKEKRDDDGEASGKPIHHF